MGILLHEFLGIHWDDAVILSKTIHDRSEIGMSQKWMIIVLKQIFESFDCSFVLLQFTYHRLMLRLGYD